MANNVKPVVMSLAKGQSPFGRAAQAVASDFKSGWEAARRDVVDITPALRQATIDLGVHPDRVEDYTDALMDRHSPRPNIANYAKPKVIPFPG